jgi:uncharacterized membrane protein YbaN (DUF454 family)
MNFFKVILIVLGTLSLCIGIIGIVVPGLPTTPFILLTAGLYLKSSDKLYQKFIANRFIGAYILEFQTNKGMTKRNKLFAIGTMWIMITLSCVFFIVPYFLKFIVSIIGLIGTYVMGIVIPTRYSSNNNNH